MTTNEFANALEDPSLPTLTLRQNISPKTLPRTTKAIGVQPAIRSTRELRRAKYARNLVLSDSIIICCTVFLGQLIRFSDEPVQLESTWAASLHIGYTLVSVLLAVLWMAFLALGSRSPRITERGLEEYAVLAVATVQLFGLIAIMSLLLHLEVSRGYLAIALPLGLTGLMINRWWWRHAAARKRRRGENKTRLLIVGSTRAAHDIATEFARDPWAGYQVVGICTPEGPTDADDTISVAGQAIPIVGMDQAILGAVQSNGVHTVALAATHQLRPIDIRRLMWELEALGVDLMVAPGLIDVADQRLWSRPVAGMAMFEVAKPQYSRANSLLKRGFDIIFALAALVLVSPVMILTAIAVRLTSPGPVFYRSDRIGINGTEFRMVKFRSMYVDAESRMPALIADNGGNPLFFKIKDDPRVTRVGKVIRKFSIDELPQFFNVLRGDMSVVGPRPQVRREVDSYDDLVCHRLTVKPGLTGLWQVSGRSDLEIEDAVRLDLSYVENWSLLQDLIIIGRTVRTVLRGDGAY